MPYNNVFPMSYQNPYYQQILTQQMPNQQPVQNNNNIIWVSGEAGAKSYMVAPNTTVQLWDSEANVIYLKSADASGMPSMRILDYTIRGAQPQAHADITESYVTRGDLDALEKKLSDRIDGILRGAENGKSDL